MGGAAWKHPFAITMSIILQYFNNTDQSNNGIKKEPNLYRRPAEIEPQDSIAVIISSTAKKSYKIVDIHFRSR